MQDDLEQAMLNGGGDEEDDQILGNICGGKTMMETTVEELKGNSSPAPFEICHKISLFNGIHIRRFETWLLQITPALHHPLPEQVR